MKNVLNKFERGPLVCILLSTLALSAAAPESTQADVPGGCPVDIIDYWKLDETAAPFSDYAGGKGTDARCSETGMEEINDVPEYCPVAKPDECPDYLHGKDAGQDCDTHQAGCEALGNGSCFLCPYPDSSQIILSCPVSTQGKIGKALIFNGSTSGLTIPAASAAFNKWQASDDFSIEFWMTASFNGAQQTVTGRHGLSGTATWWLGVSALLSGSDYNYQGSSNKATFYLRDNAYNIFIVAGTTDVTDGNWHHIVGVKNGNQISIYVDGRKEGAQDAKYTDSFITDYADLYVGWMNQDEGYQFHFNGTIDELALYDRALSDDEIQNHYKNGNAGKGYCYTSIAENPLSLDFSVLVIGGAASRQVTLTNNSAGPVALGPVSLAGTNADQFSIQSETCSAKPLTPSETCIASVVFSPKAEGTMRANLLLTTNAPEIATITIPLTGTGSLVPPPSSLPNPVLGSPGDGQTGLDTTVKVSWSEGPHNDKLTYHLYLCEDNSFAGCAPNDVRESIEHKAYSVGIVSGSGLLFIVAVIIAGVPIRRNKIKVNKR